MVHCCRRDHRTFCGVVDTEIREFLLFSDRLLKQSDRQPHKAGVSKASP